MKGLEIYTPDGIFLGVVDDVIIDITGLRADSLYVERASPVLVDEGVAVAIPFRWIQSVGDIIILSHFPSRVCGFA